MVLISHCRVALILHCRVALILHCRVALIPIDIQVKGCTLELDCTGPTGSTGCPRSRLFFDLGRGLYFELGQGQGQVQGQCQGQGLYFGPGCTYPISLSTIDVLAPHIDKKQIRYSKNMEMLGPDGPPLLKIAQLKI